MIGIQQRLVELGRIRMGEKGDRGPKRLTKFRLTSASRSLLEEAAKLYGGTVRAWQGAPDDGYWELYTTADSINIVIPPMGRVYSLSYEMWDGGTANRRCDGEIEQISGQECLCDPAKRDCAVTTRVQVMLPDLPGLGVWRVESHGYNAAAKLPSSLELLRALGSGSFTPAILRLVAHSKRVRLPDGKVQTHRWMEPEIDTPETIGALIAMTNSGPVGVITNPAGNRLAGAPPLAIDAGPSRPPRGTKVERPALGPAPELPERSDFRKPEQPAPAAAPPPPAPFVGSETLDEDGQETYAEDDEEEVAAAAPAGDVGGWAIVDEPPPAPKPPEVKRPRKGAQAPEPPPPLSADELKGRIKALPEDQMAQARAVFERRFPNVKNLAELDDAQRGRYWQEFQTTTSQAAAG